MLQLYPVLQNVGIVIPMAMFGIQAISVSTMLTAAAKTFHANYESNFKTDFLVCNPRMAPLGYDFARGFMGNLAVYGHDFNTQSAQDGTIAAEPKLQSDPRFITVGGNGGYVSRSMWLVHFKKDMSIVKISAQ